MESRGKRVINIPTRFRTDVGANSLEADESKSAAAVDTNPASGISSTGAELPPVPAQASAQAQASASVPALAPASSFAPDAWAESLRQYKQKSKISTSAVKSAAASSSSSTSETRSPKNKITVGYATNDALFKDIIGMLLAGMSISAITTVLCNANNKYREILTQKATPDQECKIARDANAEGLTKYKNASERNIGKDAYDVNHATQILINSVPAVNGLKRPFYLAMVLDKTKGKKRMTSVPFTPSQMGDCGNCWLCNLPVYYYWQNENGYINTTGCGDCEHVGAIVAAFLAGMLSNQGNPAQFKRNYQPSHPHCNKWKSNTIPMKFNKNSGQWVLDSNGIATIANDIAKSPIHGSEYCPLFIKEYNNNEITVENVKSYVNKPATEWCKAANGLLATYINQKKANIASALASIIAKTAPKLISTTTVNSVKKVKMQRKQSGGCGAGDNIFVEEIPGEDAVNIYDTNTFYELKSTNDDKELNSLQEEYNAIFDERAGEEAVDIAFECLFNVFDALEDPYKIGSGVTGIINVLRRYLYGLDQDAVKNQELIDDINSRIRTITMEFGGELKETDYEVLDIINDAPAKVVSSAIVSPLKKQDIKTSDNVSDWKVRMINESDTQTSENEDDDAVSAANRQLTPGTSENEDAGSEDDEEVSRNYRQSTHGSDDAAVGTKRHSADITNNGTPVAVAAAKGDTSQYKRSKTPVPVATVGPEDGTQPDAATVGPEDGTQSKKYGEATNTFMSIADTARLVPDHGGKRLNKRQSKQKSQKRNQKNKTKRISYIKNKQTRKNKHSKKTKSKRSNKK